MVKSIFQSVYFLYERWWYQPLVSLAATRSFTAVQLKNNREKYLQQEYLLHRDLWSKCADPNLISLFIRIITCYIFFISITRELMVIESSPLIAELDIRGLERRINLTPRLTLFSVLENWKNVPRSSGILIKGSWFVWRHVELAEISPTLID